MNEHQIKMIIRQEFEKLLREKMMEFKRTKETKQKIEEIAHESAMQEVYESGSGKDW